MRNWCFSLIVMLCCNTPEMQLKDNYDIKLIQIEPDTVCYKHFGHVRLWLTFDFSAYKGAFRYVDNACPLDCLKCYDISNPKKYIYVFNDRFIRVKVNGVWRKILQDEGGGLQSNKRKLYSYDSVCFMTDFLIGPDKNFAKGIDSLHIMLPLYNVEGKDTIVDFKTGINIQKYYEDTFKLL